jgi:hypothetical protein
LADDGPGFSAGLIELFSGDWILRRRIQDRKARALGHLAGRARFTADAGGLRFSERGELRFGAVIADASRDYGFTILGRDRFRVCFADGRLFHEAQVVNGAAAVSHDCAPDLYRGRYRFETPDRWWLSWRITGPRKDLVIVSVFSRP